jgi:hypothetical protein
MILLEWRIAFNNPPTDKSWVYNPQEKKRTQLRGFKSRLSPEMAALSEEERMALSIHQAINSEHARNGLTGL